jgi:hypothetical protein
MSYPDVTPTNGVGLPNTQNIQNINDSIKKLGGIFGKK